MIVYLDSNVLLDVLLDRGEFLDDSLAVWRSVESGEISGAVCAGSFDNLHFILRKLTDGTRARDSLRRVHTIFSLVEVDERIIEQALASPLKDFEDAIQYHCWIRSKADYLLTRNLSDFPRAKNIISPAAFIARSR